MLSDVYTIWLREMIRYVRAKTRIITSLVMPLLWLALIGTTFSNAFRGALLPGGVDYLSFMAPGIVAMTLLFTSIFTGVSVIFDREFGFLKEILVAPVSRLSIALGKITGGVTIAMIQGIIMLVIAIAMGVHFAGTPGIAIGILGVLFVMILLSATFVSMGIAFASKIESMEGFQMVMNFLVMPMFFLSSALYPVEFMPDVIKPLVYIDPLTYGVDALRYFILGASEFSIFVDISVLLLFCFIILAISWYFFKKM